MEHCLYYYTAKVVNVYDGDTITVDLDLGCGVWLKNEKIRLYGINAPEITGKEKLRGIKSRDWLKDKIADSEIIIQTVKDKKGKYGRLLGIIWGKNKIYHLSINDQMVMAEMAERKEY